MARYTWNENTSPGTGAIKCAACGEPLNKHKLTERCPALGDERVTAPRPRKREQRQRKTDAS